MKCSKCGKEFGNGSTCMNCGADRVSALGEFEGFGREGIKSSRPTHTGNVQQTSSGYVICYHCLGKATKELPEHEAPAELLLYIAVYDDIVTFTWDER